MKKLKLTAFQLGNSEILTRQQLRNVLGGDVGSSTTTTALTSTKNCSMNSCTVAGVKYSCTTDTSPTGGGQCKCWSSAGSCAVH
jgi:hypothetical protein